MSEAMLQNRAGEAPQAVGDDERAATCALSAVAGVGPQSLALLRERFGSLAAAVDRDPAELAATPELRQDGAAALAASKGLAERGRWLLEKARSLGARVLLAGEPGYPELLGEGPPVLYVLGTLPEARRVAVVGSRAADRYGLHRTAALVELFVRSDLEIVSGGAEGVDKVAHEKALALGGRTVAVVGTGLLNPYPKSHAPLYERIAARGAVVSEFSVDAGGQRPHFPRRNRTMAGLSEAVAFIRGASDSGAISTCKAALTLQRPVFAVPGNVGDRLAEGPNQFLSEGTARPLVDGRELVRALGLAAGPVPTAQPKKVDLSIVSPPARQLFETLGPAPRHVDELAREAGISSSGALASLLELELAGLCAALPGTYFQRR